MKDCLEVLFLNVSVYPVQFPVPVCKHDKCNEQSQLSAAMLPFCLHYQYFFLDISVVPAHQIESSFPMDTNDKTNKSISITCVVKSYPRETAVFFRLGEKRVNESDRLSIHKTVRDSVTTAYVMNIYHVSYEDTGVYYCEATNGFLTERKPVRSLNVYSE